MEAKSISRKAPLACDVSIFLFFFSDGMPILNNQKMKKKTSGNRGCMVAICHPQNITKTRSDYHQLKPFKGDWWINPRGSHSKPWEKKGFWLQCQCKKKRFVSILSLWACSCYTCTTDPGSQVGNSGVLEQKENMLNKKNIKFLFTLPTKSTHV